MVIQCLFHLCSHGALVYSQKCLEEKNEILQGKLSQLEEHLARLRENPPREKGEVLGDVLQVGMHRSCAGLVWTHVCHVRIPGNPQFSEGLW